MYDLSKRVELASCTVGDLINILDGFDQDTEVYFSGENGGYIHVDGDKGLICIDPEDLYSDYDDADDNDPLSSIKKEYLKGDVVMSEMLRDERYSWLDPYSMLELLEWAGEDDLMTVDESGNIVEKNAED